MKYIRDHWRGGQSLAWSFWVNLVLLRAAIFWLERFTGPPFVEDPRLSAAASVAFLAAFHVIVYAWQIVGVLRAGDRFLARSGSSIWVPAAHVGIIASLMLTSVSIFASIQTLFVDRGDENKAEAWERERAGRYALTLIDGGHLVHLTGDFELGITKNLASLLREHPRVEGVLLRSDGGYISEGRGVARLIQRHGLDTYVGAVCKSACATAFIGGATRVLREGGKLGFHQYALEAGSPGAPIDLRAEQEKDRAFFEEQGVAGEFLGRIFDTPHREIWFPDPQELLDASVVHRIARDLPTQHIPQQGGPATP
jgi:hypothetical protein